MGAGKIIRSTLEADDIQAITDSIFNKLKPLISNSPTQTDDLMDIDQLCDYLKVTRQWVYERTHLYEIPFIKLSNKMLRFRKKEIDKWLDARKTPVATQSKMFFMMVA